MSLCSRILREEGEADVFVSAMPHLPGEDSSDEEMDLESNDDEEDFAMD